MQITELFFLLKWVTLSSAISLLMFKYWFNIIVLKNKMTPAKSKWLGWYKQQEFYGVKSPTAWEIMQKNNRITTAMWICVSVSSILFFTNGL